MVKDVVIKYMKSLKKCVTFIIITLLLLGLSHPIMAEDSSGENQGNGEDTQNDTTPLLGDPMRNGGGNQTLTITISSGSDPIEDETWAFLLG